MDFKHISVLLDETIDGLDIKPDGIYVDGTLGGGGHSYEICKETVTERKTDWYRSGWRGFKSSRRAFKRI